MTYQSNGKHLTSLIEYFDGGVSIAYNRLNTHFLVRVINNNHLKYLLKLDIVKNVLNVTIKTFLAHPRVHHAIWFSDNPLVEFPKI